MKRIGIALVGDFDEKMHTHLSLNESIRHCKPHLSFELEARWVSTLHCREIMSTPDLYNGIWVAPGSPYKNESNVLELIRWARENNIPMLGSCGGFQFMVLEYARNRLGITDAGHAESGYSLNPVISMLSCSLRGQEEHISIPDKESWLFDVFQSHTVLARYYCSYGVNPTYYETLNQHPFVFSAFSSTGEVRAFELRGHRFFRGTLFQPSLDSTEEKANPLILSFFKACV